MSIQVQALTKVYGEQKAVDNVSFTLKPGEIVGFLGPNGAGKSTTMKMITGYLPPTTGKATVCGFDSQTQAMEVRRRVGYLPEANPLYFDMYVREYLRFNAGIHGITDAGKRVEAVIERTGLGKEAHKRIGMLSKGYKQRVGLAQALLHEPEVLILDEPTSGLDPNQLTEIRGLITSLGADKTVLLSSHILQEVQAVCSRVLIINNGRIVADDAIASLQAGGPQTSLLLQLEQEVPHSEIRKIAGVKKAHEAGPRRWLLESEQPEALRRAVLQWSLDKNISIISLQSETKSLEDVFRNLTK